LGGSDLTDCFEPLSITLDDSLDV